MPVRRLGKAGVGAVVLAVLVGCTPGSDEVSSGVQETRGAPPTVTSRPAPSPVPTATPASTPTPTPSPTVARTPQALAPSGPFATDVVTLTGPGGDEVRVPVYVADDSPTRRRGLMGVDDLPDDAGMVFRFDDDASSAFTMRDTLLPLSIAFADADGRIVALLDMDPCQAEPCPSYDPQATYRTALEVNQGFFARTGIDDRWRLDDPGLVD